MKNLSKSKKITAIVIALVILAGIIMLVVKGFNKDISYQKSTKIEVNIPQGYEKNDIKQIADEVFSDKNIEIQEIEKTNQVVSIRIKNYTEDELNSFKAKISEKYDIKEDKLTIYEIEVPATKITTIVTPYVFPISLVTILSVVYIVLRNVKKDAVKKVARLLTSLIVMAGLYFSIIVIIQIPVNEYIMPIALAVYVATLLITVIKLNKE